MDVEVLSAKVLAARQKVEKCQGTIARHEKQLEKKIDAAVKLGCDVRGLSEAALNEYKDNHRNSLSNEQFWVVVDITSKFDDIKGAKRKLADAEQTLQNWESKLANAIEMERTIEANCPPVIRVFVEQWKVNCTEFYQNKYRKWPEFTAGLKNAERAARITCLRGVAEVGAAQFIADNHLEGELWKRTSLYEPAIDEDKKIQRMQAWTEAYTDDWNHYCENNSDFYLNNVFPRNLMDAYLKSCELDWRGIAARRREFGGDLLLKMVEYGDEDNAFAYLEKALEAEKKAKIIDLVNRIENIVGRIVDGDHLQIGLKGDLEGIIIGDKSKAKINTIGAGGYNVQCYHYRTLIHECKEKELPELNSVLNDAYVRSGETGSDKQVKPDFIKE